MGWLTKFIKSIDLTVDETTGSLRFNPSTVGEQSWTKVRENISLSETIVNLYTEPSNIISIPAGSNLVELKADFASVSDSATIQVIRSVVPISGANPEWEKIGTVNLEASSEKSNSIYFGTDEIKNVDFRSGDRLAFFATTLSGTIVKLYARFVS